MGDRGQVYIHDDGPGVYLYTHWGASDLPDTVNRAISKRWRWDDYTYLARIIFEEMISGDPGGETGFGIGAESFGDVWRVIDVDCSAGTITVDDIFKGSFEKFLAFVELIP